MGSGSTIRLDGPPEVGAYTELKSVVSLLRAQLSFHPCFSERLDNPNFMGAKWQPETLL